MNVPSPAVNIYDTYSPLNGGDLAFDSDGYLYMATRSGNGLYEVWTAPTPDNLLSNSLPVKVTGMAITDANQLLISAQGNTNLVLYNTLGAATGDSFALMLDGEAYTLRDGDMASGCSIPEPYIEGCENYKLYYVNSPGGGGSSTLLEVTLHNDGTASSTSVLTNVGDMHIGISQDGTLIYGTVGNKLKTIDATLASVLTTQTIKNAGGTALSGFTAVVVGQNDKIYAGRPNQVYTIDPTTSIATPFGPSRQVNGGDLIELDNEIWLITRNNNTFTNVLTGASFTVPVNEINGAAVLGNGMVLLADGNGASLLKVVDPSTQAVVRTYDMGFPLVNGDLAYVCIPPDTLVITGACYATNVVEYVQGTTLSGGAIDLNRTDPTNALGAPERIDEVVFVSLGYGGSLTLAFDGAIPNGPGDDIEIVETSFGCPSCINYPEYADVFVSVNGIAWHFAKTVNRTDGFIDLDSVAGGALDYVYFVKIVNNDVQSTTHDAFDVDGVVAIHNCIDEEVDVPPTNPFIAVDAHSVLITYPNPTKGPSKVVFTTGQTTRTLVEVYDLNGRNVATLFNQEAQQGEKYTLDFNGSKLPNGVYIYRMTTDNETIVEKFMIAR